MTTVLLAADLRRDEGLRLQAYPDPRSALARACAAAHLAVVDYPRLPAWKLLSGAPWTIGYGHTGSEVQPGQVITEAEADALLAADIAATETQLSAAFPWWLQLDDVRQDALVNMAFNLGVHGLAGFPETMSALEAHNWSAAANDLAGDAWAKQVGDRATRIIAMIRTGKRPA